MQIMPSRCSLSSRAYKPDSSLISLGILVVLLTRETIGQDIVFPGENRPVSQPTRDITPTSPSSSDESRTAMPSEKCGYNMILDEVTSTTPFCECDRGYLYYPKFDECYPPYMRGPCDEGHYLVLRTNRRNAECIFNPCGRDNVVWYKGSCHDMYSSKGPCPGDLALVISETTFKPTCKIIKPDSYSFIVGQPRPPGECSPGTRRAAKGKGPCRPILYSSLSPDSTKLRKG